MLREVRASLALALPLVAGQLAAVGINVVDTTLAGRHGAVTLGSVAVGSALWALVLMIQLGVLMAIPPTVSHLRGSGHDAAIAPVFRQALWLGLALGGALGFALHVLSAQLDRLGIAADLQPGATAFLRAIALGAPAMAVHFCCRYLSEGLGLTRPTMVSGLLGLLVLAPLGALLMFGIGRWDGLGAAGLGYASALVMWMQALGFLRWLARAPAYATLGLFARFDPPDRGEIGRLLRLGLPLGVSVIMEGSLFVAAAVVIGGMGTQQAAAHQIALNVASVTFMLPLGVAMATTVRVGFAAGARDHAGVRAAALAGFAITGVTQFFSLGLLLLAARPIAGFYSADPAIAALAAHLLLFAAVFQLSDGMQVAAAGALRGLKDVRVPMLVTAVAYWGIGFPLGAWLALVRDQGAAGMWIGLAAGLTAAALLLLARLRVRLASEAGDRRAESSARPD